MAVYFYRINSHTFVSHHLCAVVAPPQMSFPVGGDDRELRVTTEVNVFPDWLPYRACMNEDECFGILR